MSRLNRDIGPLHWPEIGATFWKSLLATGLMSLACLGAMAILPAPETPFTRILLLGIPCLVGVGVYWALARAIGLTELDEFFQRS